jgi:hypothetical protein
LQVPNLDSRTYNDLVAEAKQRIPRYLPEWTNLNDSDPGITLLQLFAWMTEATLYELNQAPEALRLKLLQLLGFEAQPAQPAVTQLAFTLTAGTASTIIPKGTRVAASGATLPDGSPVVFETDSAVVAIGAALLAVASVADGVTKRFFDPTQKPTPTFVPFAPILTPADAAAMYFAFDASKPFPKVDVDLAFFLDDAPGDDPAYACTFDQPPAPPAKWVWEYFDPAFTSWRPAKLIADSTSALYRSGHVVFSFPVAPQASSVLLGLSAYWVRARIVQAQFEAAPVLTQVTTNTAPATQALTVTNEIAGGSDGTPSQAFSLAHAPVLPGTLQLQIDEGIGAGAELWEQVPDFYGSSADAKVYTLNATTGQITFPDGMFGSVPLANPTNQNNIVALSYRYGGGSAGNVAAATITDLQSYVAYVDSVVNPAASFGGADEETPQAASQRAAHAIKSTNRAVTAEDFEALALSTPGVELVRTHALPLFHPDFPGIAVPGCVTVIVVPDSDDPTRPPKPNATTLQLVCAWLDQHRLVTTELHVIGATFRTVTFTMTAVCSNDSDLAAVTQAIDTTLRELYAPVRDVVVGSDSLADEDDDGVNAVGWPWGASLIGAVAFAKTMNVPGVRLITDFVITLDGNPLPSLGNADIGPAELLWIPADGISISPQYEGAGP